MKNILMLAATVGILMVSTSVTYYFFVLVPKEQAQTQQAITDIRTVVTPSQQPIQTQPWQTTLDKLKVPGLNQ